VSETARAGCSCSAQAPLPGYWPSLTRTVVLEPSNLVIPTVTTRPGATVASTVATSTGEVIG
jgi:hypothetical protein